MKFPGRRKSRHYFAQNERGRLPFEPDFGQKGSNYIIGICQLLVDIEAKIDDQFLFQHDLKKGESLVISDEKVEKMYQELKTTQKIIGEFAGGTVGNTLHNFCMLADTQAVLLGAITENIKVGDYAFKYICNTHSNVNLSHLLPCQGPMGRAICLVTADNERTFVISRGIMDELTPEAIPAEMVAQSSSLLITAFLMRDFERPMFKAVEKAVAVAKEHQVPVVMGLGTAGLVEHIRPQLIDFIQKHVTILACNLDEAQALTGISDPLLAGEKLLDWCDLVLLTVGAKGLYICAHTDLDSARTTKDQIHSKSIPEYNLYEYSRAQRKSSCVRPIKIYTHINPFMGGPMVIKNTNGAGDAALAALLHDIAANEYHRKTSPNSPKHLEHCLTYSSIHQISKYSNRVSYEVLNQNSPRLSHGLPDKEDCLEESYWAQ